MSEAMQPIDGEGFIDESEVDAESGGKVIMKSKAKDPRKALPMLNTGAAPPKGNPQLEFLVKANTGRQQGKLQLCLSPPPFILLCLIGFFYKHSTIFLFCAKEKIQLATVQPEIEERRLERQAKQDDNQMVLENDRFLWEKEREQEKRSRDRALEHRSKIEMQGILLAQAALEKGHSINDIQKLIGGLGTLFARKE